MARLSIAKNHLPTLKNGSKSAPRKLKQTGLLFPKCESIFNHRSGKFKRSGGVTNCPVVITGFSRNFVSSSGTAAKISTGVAGVCPTSGTTGKIPVINLV